MSVLLWSEWWLLLSRKLGGSLPCERMKPWRRCFPKLGASVSPGDHSFLGWYGMRLWNQCRGEGIPWRLCCVGWVPHSVDGVGGSFQLEQRMHNLKNLPSEFSTSPRVSLYNKIQQNSSREKRIICSQTFRSFSSDVLGKGVGLSFEHL